MLQKVSLQNAVVPRPPLSPARAALGDHLKALGGAQTEAARLLTPVHRLLARIESAEADLQAAEAERDAIAGKEAADLATWAVSGEGEQPTPRAKERQAAAAKIKVATQALEAARAALASANEPLTKAQQRVAVLNGRTEAHVIAVLTECGDTAVAGLREARQAAARAEAVAAGLREMLAERGRTLQFRGAPPESVTIWLRAAENLRNAFGALAPATPPIDAIIREASHWSELIGKLAMDANATLEG